MELMTTKFLDEGMSFIAICNEKIDEKEYFKAFTELFAEQQSLGLMAFGGYEMKLDHGVKIVYLLQPEWWDYLDHLRREKIGEVKPLDLGWMREGQNQIRREIEEAIEALYELQISVKDIATMIGIGERRVREYVDLHGL